MLRDVNKGSGLPWLHNGELLGRSAQGFWQAPSFSQLTVKWCCYILQQLQSEQNRPGGPLFALRQASCRMCVGPRCFSFPFASSYMKTRQARIKHPQTQGSARIAWQLGNISNSEHRGTLPSTASWATPALPDMCFASWWRPWWWSRQVRRSAKLTVDSEIFYDFLVPADSVPSCSIIHPIQFCI